MKKQKYDIIYPLGMTCAAAHQMKTFALRKFSGPFDWLMGADLEKRVRLVLSDFEDWMRTEDFETLPWEGGSHRAYVNKRTSIVYRHDFPAAVPVEDSIDEVRAKYERRIKRFYEEIRNARRALLVCMSGRGGNLGMEKDDVVRLADMLRAKLGRKVNLLLIEHRADILEPKQVKLREYVTLWQMRVYETEPRDDEWWGRVGWRGNTEWLRPVLERYELRGPRPMWWRRKGVIKLLCAFLPLRRWRQYLRTYIERDFD